MRKISRMTGMAYNIGSDLNYTQYTDCLYGYLATKLYIFSACPLHFHLWNLFDER